MFWKRLFNRVAKHGVCHMCDKPFPDKILVQSDDHFFCPKHAQFFEEHSWLEVMDVIATNETPNNALIIQDTKDALKDIKINSFIQTSYDEQEGVIQSRFKLLVATANYNQAKEFVAKTKTQ